MAEQLNCIYFHVFIAHAAVINCSYILVTHCERQTIETKDSKTMHELKQKCQVHDQRSNPTHARADRPKFRIRITKIAYAANSIPCRLRQSS